MPTSVERSQTVTGPGRYRAGLRDDASSPSAAERRPRRSVAHAAPERDRGGYPGDGSARKDRLARTPEPVHEGRRGNGAQHRGADDRRDEPEGATAELRIGLLLDDRHERHLADALNGAEDAERGDRL